MALPIALYDDGTDILCLILRLSNQYGCAYDRARPFYIH